MRRARKHAMEGIDMKMNNFAKGAVITTLVAGSVVAASAQTRAARQPFLYGMADKDTTSLITKDSVTTRWATGIEMSPTLQLKDNGSVRNFQTYTLRQRLKLGKGLVLQFESQNRVETNPDAKPIVGTVGKPGQVRSQNGIKGDFTLVNNDDSMLKGELGAYGSNNPDLANQGVANSGIWGAHGKIEGGQNGFMTSLSGGVEKSFSGGELLKDARAGLSYGDDSLNLFGLNTRFEAGAEMVFSQQTMRHNFGFYMPYASTVEGLLRASIDLGNDTRLLIRAQGGKFYQDGEAGLRFKNGMILKGIYQRGYDDKNNVNYSRGAVGIVFPYGR